MKRLYFLLVAAVFMSVSAFAQDKFFKKYADNEKVEYMYVSKEMRGKTSHVKMPGSIYMMGVDSLESLQMLDCSDPVLMKTMLKELDSLIEENKYEVLVNMRKSSDMTSIYQKKTRDVVTAMLTIMYKPEDKLTVIYKWK